MRSRLRVRRLLPALLSLAVLLGLAASVCVWWHHTTRPEVRLRRGQEALRRDDADEAQRQALLLEADGYLDQAHLLRGEDYLRRLRLNQAIYEFNQISRDNEEILVEASVIYGLGFLSLKKHFEAERFLLYVVCRRPDHIEAHRGLARIYYDQGALRLALDHLQRWTELDPGDGHAWRFMGLIYKGLEDANLQAAESYREALQRHLRPQIRQEVSLELAEVLTKQTKYAEALRTLADCQVEEKELQTTALELRAECLYALGRASEVLPLVDRALPDHSSSVRLLRLRALLHLDASEPQAAATLLEKALSADPSDYACRHLLAQAYQRLGHPTLAAEQRRRVEEIQKSLQELTTLNQQAVAKPWDGTIRWRLAALCEKLHRSDLARMWLEAAAACPAEKPAER